MSITDHFDRRPDAGFVRRYDSNAARRQMQISLVLILVMAAAALALAFTARLDPPVSRGGPAALKGAGVRVAETLLDNRS